MIRTICLLVTFFFSSSLFAEPLYWQASKGNLNYLILGSVHVGDQTMYPLPVNLTTFLQHSDGIVVETDIRNAQGVRYPQTKQTTQQVLSDKQVKEVKGIANLLQLDPQQLLLSPPWATALTVQMKQLEYLGYRAQDGVDLWLLGQASSKGKTVYSLESLQFQIDLLAQLPEGGKELLTSLLEQFDHNEDAAHCLLESWKSGDQQNLNQFAKFAEMSPEMEEVFIYQRNRDWAQKLATGALFPNKSGNYLVVVGALHLIGQENLLSLLESQGFTITQRSKSQPTQCQFKL